MPGSHRTDRDTDWDRLSDSIPLGLTLKHDDLETL